MPQSSETTERHQLVFRIDPSDRDSAVTLNSTRRDEMDEISEEYGFPSRSTFLRCMVELGIQNLTKDYYHDEDEPQNVDDPEARTIREMVPEGEENAVDVRNELPEMIENNLLDIVDQDPEIKRSGWEVYR